MTHREIQENFIIGVERERTALGLTQPEMAKKLGMSTSGYKKMISGETAKVDLYMACRMHEITGKMLFEICGDTSPDLNLFKRLRSLSPRQKAFIEGIIDFELQFQEDALPDADDYISVLVPTGNGEDGMIWDSANVEKVNAAAYLKRFGNDLHCGIRITSNHLHPVYHIGDILLICQRSPRDGDTGIFINRETGRAYLRKFRQTNPCRLEPINGQGVTFLVDSYNEADMAKWIKFGYVLAKMRE